MLKKKKKKRCDVKCILNGCVKLNKVNFIFFWSEIYIYIYSLRPIFFVMFEKSNFLREHHLLSCLPFKNV